MEIMKSKLSLILAALLSTAGAFALPGTKQSVPDSSGQFVYYKDASFARESYLGVIYYDESTYAFRYVAPQINDKKNPKPKLEMQVFLTVNPESDKLDFTGERVEPFPRSQEETDIINYIHDFAYEMTSRRQKVGVLEEKKTVNQDYEQFGGFVKIEYDPMIPVFNVAKIIDAGGKEALSIVTAGQLISSSDTSFQAFAGIPDKITDKAHSFKPNKKAKKNKITIDDENAGGQEFTLDSQWGQKNGMNLWTLGSVATISTVTINAGNVSKAKILRTILLGRDHSYPDWATLKIDSSKDGTISVSPVYYNADSNSFLYNFKVIKDLKGGANSIFDFSVFAGAYTPNKKYFNEILNSYKTIK